MSALVVARFRNTAEVEERGRRRMCLLKGKRLNVVVGDRVDYRELSTGQTVVEAIRERDTELTRINSAGKPEIVAANIDQIVVVVAPQPAADWFLVDRYLCAAELLAVAAAVTLNKVELHEPTDLETLASYSPIGYDTLATSARTGAGLDALRARLAERRSVLVGQSGVGKSSLLNALVPGAAERVAGLSQKSAQGRHTTSTAVLHRLPGGGELIDSPGVRDYAPFIGDARAVIGGFREFAPYPARCRFSDCRHLQEPDCAVKDAVATGKILKRRYCSFVRLTELTATLTGCA